jgi:hypothetical protein
MERVISGMKTVDLVADLQSDGEGFSKFLETGNLPPSLTKRKYVFITMPSRSVKRSIQLTSQYEILHRVICLCFHSAGIPAI